MQLNNTFNVGSGINEHTLFDLIYYIERNKNPIILLNSDGGEGDVACGIYDYLKSSNKKITAVVCGRAESAALYILMGCSKRYSFSNSVFMNHLPRLGNNTFFNRKKHFSKLELAIQKHRQIIDIPLGIISKDTLNYFDAYYAQRINLIDKILT